MAYHPRTGPRTKAAKNNGSGIPGISALLTRGRNGRRHPGVQATWNDSEGNPKNRKFSISKYGAVEATRMALDARAEGTGHPSTYTPHAAWVKLSQQLARIEERVCHDHP